jgi:hypothetical protein
LTAARKISPGSAGYVDIQQWDSKYVVLSTTTTVKFDYTLKICKSGETLWSDTQTNQAKP